MKTSDRITIPLQMKRNLNFLNTLGSAEVPTKSRFYCDWQQIMGHLHYAVMMKMPNCVDGLIITDRAPTQYRTCMGNDFKRHRNRRPDERPTKAFQFILADAHQPENASLGTLGGYKYIASFIDN